MLCCVNELITSGPDWCHSAIYGNFLYYLFLIAYDSCVFSEPDSVSPESAVTGSATGGATVHHDGPGFTRTVVGSLCRSIHAGTTAAYTGVYG